MIVIVIPGVGLCDDKIYEFTCANIQVIVI